MSKNVRSCALLQGALIEALFWNQVHKKKVTLWWVKKYLRANGR